MKKKQVLSLVLASMMVLSMTACGDSSDDKKGETAKTEDSADKDGGSGEKQKITWTFRHDGTDLEKNGLYNWVVIGIKRMR